MKIKKTIFSTAGLLLFSALFGACVSYSPFVEPMLTEYKLSNNNIKSVQFYISEEILLFKIQDEQGLGKQGEAFLKSQSGISEKIRIKGNTPCVIERIDKDGIFHVRFEEGKEKVLKFHKTGNNRYYLKTELVNAKHRVLYGGEWYYTNTLSLTAFLMVKFEQEKGNSEERRLSGKIVN